MVTDRILSILASVVAWSLNALPHVTFPAWATGLPTQASNLADAVPRLPVSTWINPTALLVALGFVMLAALTAAMIRMVRMGISHVTGGGGAT